MSNRIKAITFDLWDTIIDDESDEPKRLAQGLLPKPEQRQQLLLDALQKHHDVSENDVRIAFGVVNSAFVKCWKQHSITWTMRERLEVLLRGMDMALPERELDEIATAMGNMEVDIPPDPIEGAKEAISELAKRYKLCIISDTIVTPGTGLRQLLEKHDLKQYFSGFAFSDEVGFSKPNRAMFDSAASQLGIPLGDMVHIGDRDHNDVKGPQALGMKAVLFTAKRDVDKDTTSADAICERHSDLVATIDGLSGKAA